MSLPDNPHTTHEQPRTEQPARKRKYSKQGCKECKRRKIKCDEGKPTCWHCKRLGKQCIYLPPKPRKTRGKSDSVPVVITPIKTNNSIEGISLFPQPLNHYSPVGTARPLQQDQQQGGVYMDANASQTQTLVNTKPVPFISSNNNNILPPLINSNSPDQLHFPRSHSSYQQQSQQQHDPLSNTFPIKLPGLMPIGNGTSSPHASLIPTGVSPSPGLQIHTPSTHSTCSRRQSASAPEEVIRLPQLLSTSGNTSHSILPPMMNTPDSNNPPLGLELSIAVDPNFNPTITANSLAHSLNEILNYKIGEVRNSSVEESTSTSLMQFFEHFDYNNDTSSILSSYNDDGSPEFAIAPFPLSYFQFQGAHKVYLELFYHEYCRVIAPCTPTPDLNPARDILLTYSKDNNYLMAAIMACGALQAHRKSNDPKDESSYCSYLATCMQLLSTVLSDENKLKENIEPMILTVLLLTSYTAVSNIQKWRPHLRAAKELLTTYAPSNENLKLYKRNSYVIAFCRAWYLSIELIASLSSPTGGTMQSDREFDNMIFDLPNLEIYMQRMKFSRKDGFNLLYGYTNSLAIAIQKLIKLMRRAREAANSKPDIQASDLSDLIASLNKESKFAIASETGIIPKDHFLNPDNNKLPPPDFEPLSSEAITKIELDNGEVQYICWYDLSQHSIVNCASLITSAMICRFPKNHFIVQSLVEESLKPMIFLKSSKKVLTYALMFLQLPMYIVGLNCIESEHRELVLQFYELMHEFGNATASFSSQKLKKKWEKYDENDHDYAAMEFDDFDEEELGTDIISY